MRLTTKGRFAVTAMIDLALHQTTGPVTLAAISLRQKISMSYLEQMFSKLRRHELVASTRGPGGGYSLGRKAARITVADIVFAVDAAETAPASASALEEEGARCTAHELWASLNSRMVEFLDSVTLQQLVDEQSARNATQVKAPAVVRHATSRQSSPSITRPTNVPNSVFALGKALAKS